VTNAHPVIANEAQDKNIEQNIQNKQTQETKRLEKAKWNDTTHEPIRNFYVADWSNLATDIYGHGNASRDAYYTCKLKNNNNPKQFRCVIYLYSAIYKWSNNH